MSYTPVQAPWAAHQQAKERIDLLSDDELDIFADFGEATACTPVEAFTYLDRSC
jgi:hypothetical protein